MKTHFRECQDVCVSGDLFIYYEEGNRGASVAPDVFVVFGVPNHMRRTYLLWRKGKEPDFVMEVTFDNTREEDQERKRELYARLGISEYWQYDPTGDYLDPPLQGFTLSARRYGEALALERVGAVWSAYSPVLGLNLRLDEGGLRFHDPMTDGYLLTYLEENRARQAEAAPGRNAGPTGSGSTAGRTGSPLASPAAVVTAGPVGGIRRAITGGLLSCLALQVGLSGAGMTRTPFQTVMVRMLPMMLHGLEEVVRGR